MIYEIYDSIIAKHYDSLKDLPAPMRQSLLFQYYTQEIPVFILDTDLIAGRYGYPDDTDQIHDVKTPAFHTDTTLSSTEEQIRRQLSRHYLIDTGFTSAHTCISYQTILEKGLLYYIEKTESALASNKDNDYLKAMLHSLHAVTHYARRFCDLADTLYHQTDDETQKYRLIRIKNALSSVPLYPAQNFFEAVQAIWIMHSVIPMAEMSWASISLGRMDQYLYPFYQKELATGGSVESMKDILKNLFLLLDTYGDGACALNLGGLNITGQDMMNPLSELLIDIEKELSLRAPILAVRVTPHTSSELLDKLIDFDLFKIGQPTFYGELSCRAAVQNRKRSDAEAASFSVNSCMGLCLSGSEFADMWGIKFNMHLPLELSINHGKPMHGSLPVSLQTVPKTIHTMDDLLQQYASYFQELLKLAAYYQRAQSREAAANWPDPLLSALTDGCIERGGDRATCAKYNTVTVEAMGMINTCDSIQVINELVFEQNKYTLEQLLEAAKNNYEQTSVLADVLNCKKYGMNDDSSNIIVSKISETVAEACEKLAFDNVQFLPSLHTIDENVPYGARLYATLDGRKNKEPVCKNANPSHTIRAIEPTSLVLSAACVKQNRFNGGQPIDLYFDKSWFQSKDIRDKIKYLILTYIQLGGLQFQVNSIDLELLEKAHANPEHYPQVIVRKGGYSVRFSEMSYAHREAFLTQIRKETGNS